MVLLKKQGFLKSRKSFSIEDIPNRVLVLDADYDGSVNYNGADLVDTWIDIYGNLDYYFLQNNTPDKPIFIRNALNGKDVVRFAGNRWMRSNNGFAPLQNKSTFYMIWLVKYAWLGKTQAVFSYGTPPNYGYDLLLGAASSANTQFLQINNGADISFVSATPADTNWRIEEILFDGTGATNADRAKRYVNGIEDPLNYLGTVPTTTPNSLDYAYLGTYMGATTEWALTGDIAKLMLYSAIPTLEQRTFLKDFLTAEWGLV